MKKPFLALTLLTYGVLVVEAAAQRAYAAGNFHLSLEGVQAGILKGVEGGAITADVIASAGVGGHPGEKHLGAVRYENLNLQLGVAGMEGGVYQWISQSWSQGYTRKSGAIVAADFRMNAMRRKEFFDAVITETTFPACDVASKAPGYIQVGIAPEYIRDAKASGRVAGAVGKGDQKRWSPANFRLQIDGLDCTRIIRIESFTVRRTPVSENIGEHREPLQVPGTIEFPNLKVTLGAASAQTWQDWFQDFVVAGNNAAGSERRGTLEFLSPDRQEVLAAIAFDGLGIFRLEADQAANADALGQLTAELYCEKMAFNPGKSAP